MIADNQELVWHSRPPWRCSLIEALTMSYAEIEERRRKYEELYPPHLRRPATILPTENSPRMPSSIL